MRGDHALQLHGTACFGAREFRMKGFSFGRSSSYSHMGIEIFVQLRLKKKHEIGAFSDLGIHAYVFLNALSN
jgi:hypothetical protein